MASSSSSSSTASILTMSFNYDVFLSFRGEDTRTNFVDHLYHALKMENIETYKDDKNLEKGKKIRTELIQAIQDSRFHVIVFSKNYACSSWCLDELVKIMECQKMQMGQTVYPIFYDVEPTEVRKQSGAFGEAIANHGNQVGAKKWREALKEVADVGGWELKKTANGHEVEFIKLVVKDISSKLPAISGTDGNLIGMGIRINGVVSSLNALPNEFCMIGIAGMGGSGKTTLARAVFDQIRNEFEGSSFVENVRECSNSLVLGLKSLQQQVLRDVLKKQDIYVNGVFDGKNMMKKEMPGRKVLVVLDDVDHIDQLKALAGEPNWFKSGSKVIITTRDKQVLLAHKVNLIQDVNLLTVEEAICLLSRCTFGTKIPIPGYEELSRKVVSYAAGLPLTITILGSSLCDENEHVWIDTLKELEKIPLDGTLQKLELSYMGLDTNCKEIFLDVACILKGWMKDEAIRALESRGFHAIRGLSVLQKKYLVTISEYGYLEMHDHIEEMGRYIVRRLHSDEPNKHSRLWIAEEIEDILVNNRGTEETTCIHLINPCCNLQINPGTFMNGLGKMEKLRYLNVTDYFCSDWELDEVSQYLPNSLQYLKWEKYPFCSLPKTFEASNLVCLEMRDNKIEQLWERDERKVLDKLRFLDLSDSNLRTFDFGLTPNLEMSSLCSCHSLEEVYIPVECPKLKSLSLNSSKLRILDVRGALNLETLSLSNCYDLEGIHIPVECLKLKSLYLDSSKLRILDLRRAPNLEMASLCLCHFLEEVYIPVECPKLKSLSLSSSKLRTLDLQGALNLEILSLINCYDLVEIHIPVECLRLKSLDLNSSKLRTLDLREAPNLETLSLTSCYDLVELHIPVECLKLKSLDLDSSKVRTLDLRGALNLEALSLSSCSDSLELHIPVECLKLKFLDLDSSKLRTLDLRGAPNLVDLSLSSCYDSLELHIPVECLQLKSLDVSFSKLKTVDLRGAPNLETLSLWSCYNLVKLHIPVECLQLKSLDLNSSKLRTLDLRGALNLETLDLHICYDLVELHMPVECLKLKSLDIDPSKLRTLDLRGAPNLETLCLIECHDLIELHIPDECLKLKSIYITSAKLRTFDLGMTPNLKTLNLIKCYYLVELQTLVGSLKNLAHLDLSGCLRFKSFLFERRSESLEVGSLSELHLIAESLDMCPLHSDNNLPKFRFTCFYEEHKPSSVGNFEKLISIGLCACTDLERFSRNICGLRCLRKLTIEGGILEVPKDIGQLESLVELSLSTTKITHLPDSICMLKHLKILKLQSCWHLERLPEDLGGLECLEDLLLSECIVLRDIPNSICKMKHLKSFELIYCYLVEKLPEEFGCLECLQLLNIEGTGITHLPQSIFELKGLRIAGFRWLLESLGFASVIQTSAEVTFCHI